MSLVENREDQLVPLPAFLIVGSPRSGTTLIQRLVCELPGIGMPPETHFFGFFALDLLRRNRFPLMGSALRTELHNFSEMEKSRDLGLDVNQLYSELEGRCGSLYEMFGAIVQQLAGPASVYGEKSPEHLLWWRPLAAGVPKLKFIAVVRDARAVGASRWAVWDANSPIGNLAYLVAAERWSCDQREVLAMREALGDERVLILRYEDVVANHEVIQLQLANFLRVKPPEANRLKKREEPRHVVLPREWWKDRVFSAVTDERVQAWRESLDRVQADEISRICQKEMMLFGFEVDERTIRKRRLNLRSWWYRSRFRVGRFRHLRRINRVHVSE